MPELMNRGFYNSLPRPFFALAPMANVTDAAFRSVIQKYGQPDVFWSEFVSTEGLTHPEAKPRLLPDLYFTPSEQPIVAQIFGSRPETFTPVAALCRELGFSGIDINMGCPDRAVNKQGSGAALCRTPALAQEIIAATKAGAGELPVSVKIRLGWNQDELETWLPTLLEARPALVTIHARTRKEMSKVPARWERIARAVEINTEWAKSRFGEEWESERSLIAGNGDVLDVPDGEVKARETGADGIMIGRGIFGNPWLFNGEIERANLPAAERYRVLLEHATLFEELFGENPEGTFRARAEQPTDKHHEWLTSTERIKSFSIMKKHFGAYLSGIPESKDLKLALMAAENVMEVTKLLEKAITTT